MEAVVVLGRAKVLVDGLNIRPTAGTDGAPLGVLDKGAEVDVLAEVPRWLQIDGGWISSISSYVLLTRRHTEAADLVEVVLPYPTGSRVLLHPDAARSFEAVLAHPMSVNDLKALCRVNSSFRSYDSQMGLVRRYEAAIGHSWISWNNLAESQRTAARAAGFAYHPGTPPVDAPNTHVGGGALDIQAPLPQSAIEALLAHDFKQDAPGDSVHWGWHGH